MDTYYCCMCLWVEVDLDLMWWHMVREQMCHVACFQSHQHFLVSEFTKPKLNESKHRKRSFNFHHGKGPVCLPKSISMWWHQGIFGRIRFSSLLLHFHSFMFYFFFLWVAGLVSPFQRFSSLLRQKSISRVCLSNLWPLHKQSRMDGGVRERMQHTPRSS